MQQLRIALIALAIAWVAPARAVEVRALRLWAGPEGTQVVLELSGSAKHSLLMLKNPDRVVLDLTRPMRAKSFLATPNDRYGYRLVVDLGGPAAAMAATGAAAAPIKAEHARPEARDLIIAIDAGHGGEDPGA